MKPYLECNYAELLISQEEPDIDNLIKIVEESMSVYNACKSLV
ncbi:exodeoxyribonuclease VII small subunit [Acinetobacter sp. ULE_I001]